MLPLYRTALATTIAPAQNTKHSYAIGSGKVRGDGLFFGIRAAGDIRIAQIRPRLLHAGSAASSRAPPLNHYNNTPTVMSNSSSWLSIADLPKDAALAALDLADSGEPAQPGAAEFTGAVLPDGSYLLLLRGFHPILHPRSLEALSQEATVYSCAEMESTNAAMASQMRRGKRVWEVAHVLDEGPDHLEVTGRAPKALAALLETARKEAAQSGFDAVFSVPGALACKAAGHRAGATPGLQFTRLELVSDDPFASPACLWRRLRQDEEAESFAQAQPDLPAVLVPRIERVLAPLGFASSTRPGVKHGFTRTAGDLTLHARLAVGRHGQLDVVFEAEHALIERAVSEYAPTLVGSGEPPYALSLSFLEGRTPGPYAVHNAAALDAFGAMLEARLPHHAKRLAELRALDRAMLATYPRRPLVDFLLMRRYQLLAGAWLTGNPELPAMVEASAPTEERREQCEGLLAMLREKYQPVV